MIAWMLFAFATFTLTLAIETAAELREQSRGPYQVSLVSVFQWLAWSGITGLAFRIGMNWL